jgi:ABC-type bacteriocin/lantibiotic exporter with double-glycine peptidase domain
MKIIIGIILKGIKTRLSLVFYILLAVGAGFLVIFANDLLAILLNDYLMVQNFDGFALQIFLTAGLFALVHGSNILESYLRVNFEFGAVSRLTRHCIDRLLRAKNEYFTKHPAAGLYAGMWTASQASGRFCGIVLRMVSGAVFMIFYGIVVFRIDMWAGIFTIAALPIYFLVTVGTGNRVSALQHSYVDTVADLATVTQEGLENVGNVKAKGAYAFFAARSARVLQKLKSIVVKITVIEHYITNITGLIRLIAPLLIIFAAMGLSPGFEANVGSIMVLYINVPLFLLGIGQIHRGYIEYKMAKPFLSKLQEFNDIPQEDEGGIDITAFESLRAQGVKVEFSGGRVVTVPDFEVKNGEKVMFFGGSGVGKSTIFNIIMGLNQDYEGAVFINGINLREISLASLRRIFGITFQHTNALTLDLHQNILLGAEQSNEELERLIKLTALESQQDAKGDALLNNKVLSGGEKSRVGLAQMLAARPHIMLIDESFSNMDEELESKIIADIFRQYPDRAVICISHRNSSRPFFDRVVDFNILT